MSDEDRLAGLRASLAGLEERITAACTAAGRDRADVTLVAVTKTFPAADVVRLAALGVTDVGENRDQEARGKVADVAGAGVTGLRWHLVGRLQRNKARSVASYADVVHSVDRPELVRALDDGAARAGRRLRALVQVSLDPEPGDPADPAGRGGAAPAGVGALANAIAGAAHLDLGGVMAVAPPGGDPEESFVRLAQIASLVRDRYPGAVDVSAGMSGDLEAAIRHGATLVRVGTALLGTRPPLG